MKEFEITVEVKPSDVMEGFYEAYTTPPEEGAETRKVYARSEARALAFLLRELSETLLKHTTEFTVYGVEY